MALVAGFAVLLCVAVTPTVRTGAAPGDVRFVDLPPTATRVDYYLGGAFGPGNYVEFDVPEVAFLAWAQARGWDVRPFDEPDEPHLVHRLLSDTKAGGPWELKVRRGYEWARSDGSDRGGGWSIVYDADAGRAYYTDAWR
ncbi:MAG TPA: hypothetical protein VF796_22800 [Humisphaera sp.]